MRSSPTYSSGEGTGFVGRQGGDALRANDKFFIGFNLEIGPAGGVSVIDWYDRDICGNAVDPHMTGAGRSPPGS